VKNLRLLAIKLVQSKERNDEDDRVDDSTDMESPPPPYGVSKDTTKDQSEGESDGQASSHGSKRNIAAFAFRKGIRNDADSRREAKRDCDASDGTKDDELTA
jgi:hypothetical protein